MHVSSTLLGVTKDLLAFLYSMATQHAIICHNPQTNARRLILLKESSMKKVECHLRSLCTRGHYYFLNDIPICRPTCLAQRIFNKWCACTSISYHKSASITPILNPMWIALHGMWHVEQSMLTFFLHTRSSKWMFVHLSYLWEITSHIPCAIIKICNILILKCYINVNC